MRSRLCGRLLGGHHQVRHLVDGLVRRFQAKGTEPLIFSLAHLLLLAHPPWDEHFPLSGSLPVLELARPAEVLHRFQLYQAILGRVGAVELEGCR